MKFGKTWEERRDIAKAKCGRKRVFAFLPKLCYDSERWVWLEFVTKVTYRSGDYSTVVNHYYVEK